MSSLRRTSWLVVKRMQVAWMKMDDDQHRAAEQQIGRRNNLGHLLNQRQLRNFARHVFDRCRIACGDGAFCDVSASNSSEGCERTYASIRHERAP
jgi:hypothetical protein